VCVRHAQILGYRGPILMTYPTFAIAPIMLDDYVKVRAAQRAHGAPRSYPKYGIRTRACTSTPHPQPTLAGGGRDGLLGL
jgi:predicted metal-dependent RNase